LSPRRPSCGGGEKGNVKGGKRRSLARGGEDWGRGKWEEGGGEKEKGRRMWIQRGPKEKKNPGTKRFQLWYKPSWQPRRNSFILKRGTRFKKFVTAEKTKGPLSIHQEIQKKKYFEKKENTVRKRPKRDIVRVGFFHWRWF